MIRAAVFDAYGTLFDVDSAMRRYAERLGPEWQRISQEWRAKHVEYSWVRSLAGRYRGFWTLAKASLAYVAARHGITDEPLLDGVLSAYRRLDPYPDVQPVLQGLKAKGIARAVLSNGGPQLLADSVEAAGLHGLLDAVLSVDAVHAYKPDPRVYRLATERFDAPPDEIAFVSANAWDAFGAREFGFRVFRVNRGGLPDEYALRGTIAEVSDLTGVERALT